MTALAPHMEAFLREYLVRWLVAWGLLLGLFLCCLGVFWLGWDCGLLNLETETRFYAMNYL